MLLLLIRGSLNSELPVGFVPYRRILKIERENRILKVGAEIRSIQIENENRSLKIEREIRYLLADD